MAKGNFKGGKREKAKLKYAPEVYTPIGAKSLTEPELKKEYSRLRSIARKRLERFENTEWVTSQQYIQNKGKYVPIKDIKSDTELRHLFTELARFITAETGSVSGLNKQRDKMIETFNDRGYDFVNKNNIRKFVDFMEFTRNASLGRIYDSKRVAELFDYAEQKNMKSEDLRKTFNKWRKSEERNDKKIQNIDPRNSSMFRDKDFL